MPSPFRGAGLVPVFPLAILLVVADFASSHVPHDEVADIAVSPDYAEDQTVFAIIRGRFMRSADGGRTWAEMVRGLGDQSQDLMRMAVAPTDARRIYLTSRTEGVLKSEDGGVSWRSASDGLTNLYLREIAVSPGSADIVVAAGAGSDGGLFRTSDGGASWSRVAGVERVTSLAFLTDSSRLVVGDAHGRVFVSGDAGDSWDPALVPDPGGAITAIATGIATDSTEIVFAATAAGRVFRSEAGRSFVPRADGLPDEDVQALELSPGYADDSTLWASTWQSGVFRSTDGGEKWEPLHDGLTTDQQANDLGRPHFGELAVAVDGSGEQSLFVGGFNGFFRYDRERAVWEPVATLTDYIVGLGVSPNFADDGVVAVTTYVKGAILSRDGGRTWRFANDGLVRGGTRFAPVPRLHNVVFSPDYARDGTIFSATWRHVLKSTDRGASWNAIQISPPPGGRPSRQLVLAVSPSYASDRTVFAGTRYGEIYRSEGGGEADTWTRVGTVGERVRSLVVSPAYSSDRVLYAGTLAGIHTSGDAGGTWERTGPRIEHKRTAPLSNPASLVAISPAYAADATVFAGTRSGLFVTRNAGRSWNRISTAPLTDSSHVVAVAVSPAYDEDRTVLVSTLDQGLLRSTDAGGSFHRVGVELLEANLLVSDFTHPTSAPIQFSPTFATDRTIFGYAQTGLVRSTDGGDAWEILHLPSGSELLASLGLTEGWRAERGSRWRLETPAGTLSARRVLAAAAAGLLAVTMLWTLGVGGGRTGRALGLQLTGGGVVFVIALVALAI